MLTPAERELLNELKEAESFEQYFEDSADLPVVARDVKTGGLSSRVKSKTKIGQIAGNPAFKAQFDIQILAKYFTLTSGTYTEIQPSSLNAGLKTQLPVFLFLYNDFNAGYAKLRQITPLNTWTYNRPFVVGRDAYPENYTGTVTQYFQTGDLVIPVESTLPGSGTVTRGFTIIRCNQVAYGTLLNAIASDRFVINNIRYNIPDTSKINQFANQIGVHNLSLFGKFDSDYVSPNSFKDPKYYQAGIIDIPLNVGIDKQKGLSFYLNYDCTEINWSVFVWSVAKL